MLECDDTGVVEFLHDLQFTVLVSLVLVNLLDGYYFTGLCYCGLVIRRNY
jgi:hypothetical protein